MLRLCKIITTLCFILLQQSAQGQSLLDLLEEDEPEVEYVNAIFKSTRVINGHSIEMLSPGALDFRILHRFGPVNRGYKDLFGLDQASMRMGFDYGITKHLSIGIGRSTLRKELDGFIKYRLIAQQKGKRKIPLSVVLVSGMTMNGLPYDDPTRVNYFTSRLAYYHQVMLGRKFNDNFSLQLSPTMVHRNIVATPEDEHDIYALGVGGRLKLTKRVAFMIDYFYVLKPIDAPVSKNPLSIGFDIETGGHVFQLHFSNSQGMNERAFILDTNTSWLTGEIRFGFNLSRMFQIKRYEH